MRQNSYKNYMESEVLNADPIKLVCLLYAGALERIREARHCLRQCDIAGRSRAISRATAVVNELMLSVDRKSGGDISRTLVELYDYVVRLFNEANFRQTEAPLAEAEQLLRTLSQAWEECRVKSERDPEEEALYAPVSCAG